MDPILVRFYLDIFLQALARNLPWIMGGLGVAGLVGFSPLGRAIATALRERHRGFELEEGLAGQLAELQRTLSDVTERLDATEQHLHRQRLASKVHPNEPAASPSAGEAPSAATPA
jgi:hypothetical protein